MVAIGSPRTLGRYALLTELATSHLGPLWLVRASSGDDEGTVASMRRVRLGPRPDQKTVDRLSEAAWTAMEVADDLVAKVSEVLVQGNEIGVVQDYVEGVTLRTVQRSSTTRRRPVPPEMAVRFVRDLLEALAGLHAHAGELGELAPSLFGGVSPDSVVVTTSGRCQLFDPLVAGVATTIDSIRNHSDRIAYTSPEQNETSEPVDAPSDVFCAGILLWELLAERRLFMGMGKSIAQKVKALKIPRLDELDLKNRPPIPTPLADVAARALERDRNARFGSPSEMLAALDAAGMAAAPPERVAEYLEELAEFELRKQREATAGSGARSSPGRQPHGAPQPTAPGERSAPAVNRPPPAPQRGGKKTLLGIAPPKPVRSAPAPLPEPPSAVSEPEVRPASEPIPEPAAFDAEAATLPRSPDSTSLDELGAWDEPPPTTNEAPAVHEPPPIPAPAEEPAANEPPAGDHSGGTLAMPAVPGDLAPAASEPAAEADEAFDAELEEIYDEPVAMRGESMNPAPPAEPAAPGPVAPSPVAAALAETLDPAPLVKGRPGEVELLDLDTAIGSPPGGAPHGAEVPGERTPPGTIPPAEPAAVAADATPATAPGSPPAPAPAAVPLIHDHRFDGPGPEARVKTSFWGGIIIGAVITVVVTVAALLLVVWLGTNRKAPATASATPVSAAPPTAPPAAPASAQAREGEADQPQPPEITEASDATDADEDEASDTDESTEAGDPEADAPPTADPAPRQPAPRQQKPVRSEAPPRPKPKPTFVPDEI